MFDQNLDNEGFLTTPRGSSSFRKAIAVLQRSTGIRPITNNLNGGDEFLLKNSSRSIDRNKAKTIQFTNNIYPLLDFGLYCVYTRAISAVEHQDGFVYLKVKEYFKANPLAVSYETKAYKKWLSDNEKFINDATIPIPTFAKYNSIPRSELEKMEEIIILDQDEYCISNGRLYILGDDMPR